MAVVVEKATRLIQQNQERVRAGIAEILSEDQKIEALFQRCLRDVHETSFVRSPTAFEALCNVSWHGYRSALHLRRQAEGFILRETRSCGIDAEHQCMCFLPN